MSSRTHDIAERAAAETFTPARRSLLQRCGAHACPPGKCDDDRKKRSLLQRRPFSGTEPATVPPIVTEVLRAPGQPLDPGARALMEPRFGHDFRRVRVHTDAKAAESARAVNALAYTVGRDVVFGAGAYAPGSTEGRRLLAHELAHVVQQGASLPPVRNFANVEIAPSTDSREAEAVSASEGRTRARMTTAAETGLLFRQEKKEETKEKGKAPGLACRNTCYAAHRTDIAVARAMGDEEALKRAEAERDACISECQEAVDRVPRPPGGRPGILYILRQIWRLITGK